MVRGKKQRPVVLIGVEGKSDLAFVRFLAKVCEVAGLRFRFDMRSSDGGDSLSVVEVAVRRLDIHSWRRSISEKLVLLDSDRIQADQAAGRDAYVLARKMGFKVVLMTPNLEGLLVRLHKGCERHKIAPSDSMRRLISLWPGYGKGSLRTSQLKQRFTVDDLHRAAKFDEDLLKSLRILGLVQK